MDRKDLARLVVLALVTSSMFLIPPLFRSAEAQTGNAILMDASLVDHPNVGDNPPDVMSMPSCFGLTTFAKAGITSRFTDAYEPCFVDIRLPGPNGQDDLCGDDDICLVGAGIVVGRDKATGEINSVRMFLWDMDGTKYSTDVLGAYSEPDAPDGSVCYTVHVDQTGILVRPGEALGKKKKAPVGTISWDDLVSCP